MLSKVRSLFDSNLLESKREVFNFRVSALIEMAFFFAVALLLSHFFDNGQRFFYVNPHPFWIIVLLMAVQYGTNEALLAALLSTIALLAWNLPEQSVLQDRFEYLLTLLKNPLLWFVAAVMIGEIRLKTLYQMAQMEQEVKEAKEKEHAIATSYSELKEVKEGIEMKLAGEMKTALSTYAVFKKLEEQKGEEILASAHELIAHLLNPPRFSVYVLNSEGLRLLGAHGWKEESSKLPTSYPPASSLYQQIVSERKLVAISNEKDREVLSEAALAATPLYDEDSGQVFGMLKIEELPFFAFTVANLETFSMIGKWVGRAYANHLRVEETKEKSFVTPESLLFSANFFEYQKEYLEKLGRRLGFDVVMIKIRATNFDPKEKSALGHTLKEVVTTTLRGVDQAFDYQKEGLEFGILLAGTPVKNCHIVIDKIKKKWKELSSLTLDLDFDILAIYEKPA